MYLKFWGARNDGEYAGKKGNPRPGWTYRCVRRNAARLAHWPMRYRWRVWTRMLREKIAAMKAAKAGPVTA